VTGTFSIDDERRDAVAVDRLAITWRADDVLDQQRLDRLVALLIDGPLEEALDDVGLGDEDEVCLRVVDVASHEVRWEQGDAELVAGWSRSIARGVRDAVASAPSDAIVVRYRTRAHAVIDIVDRAVARDLDRSWAWAQLGLWPVSVSTAAPSDGEIASWVGGLLVDHPSLVVPAVTTVARRGRWADVVALVGWDRLATATGQAWQLAGGLPVGRRAVAAVATDRPDAVRHAAALAQAIARRSTLARTWAASGASSPDTASTGAVDDSRRLGTGTHDLAATIATTVAMLAVLDVEPSTPARGTAALELVAAVVDELATPDAPPDVAADSTVLRPATSIGIVKPAGDAEVAELVGIVTADDVQSATTGSAGLGSMVSDGDGVDPSVAGRAGAHTAWGGLLFLLHLVDGAALARRVASDSSGTPVSTRGLLHAVGRRVLARAVPDAEPVGERDPAVLAFCGLAPDADPPVLLHADDPEAWRQAQRLVVRETDLLLDRLRARVEPRQDAHERAETALLLAVCRRHAVIEHDPGWLDVMLDLDEVSTDVRRAGLDLDLGYLPWLGCVVRFRYG